MSVSVPMRVLGDRLEGGEGRRDTQWPSVVRRLDTLIPVLITRMSRGVGVLMSRLVRAVIPLQ